MKLKDTTILITGGTSGIGFEIAKQLLIKGAKVIVTGRDQAKLDETKRLLPNVQTIKSDVADPKQIDQLMKTIESQFPETSILINNAGIMNKINMHDDNDDLVQLTKEIDINLMGPIRMTKKFLPHLKAKKTAAIMNVSSGLAFVPLTISPVYSATKAGLHSFTQALRIQLKNTSVSVFELAPPGTDTPLFTGEFTAEERGGVKAMDVAVLAKAAIAGLERNIFEIRPGMSNALKWMSRVAPDFAAKMLSQGVDSMLANTNSNTNTKTKSH